jgi:hypothetical protein
MPSQGGSGISWENVSIIADNYWDVFDIISLLFDLFVTISFILILKSKFDKIWNKTEDSRD